MNSLAATVALITMLASIVVALFEWYRNLNNRFAKCSEDLHSNNPNAQIASAILLRSFLKNIFHKKDTLNLISALLRVTPNGNLQKTLGDSLSFVESADGQDFQKTNLHHLSVKSNKRIRFEIEGNEKYNVRQNFRNADFYKADLSDSSIYNINFNKAFFIDALLNGTSFHNCTFEQAVFKDADLRNTKFYACTLVGAQFKGANYLTEAYYSEKEKKENAAIFPILNNLEKNGSFSLKRNKKPLYIESHSKPKIFISHLGMNTSSQELAERNILDWLKDEYKIEVDMIHRKDYRDSGQLNMVKDHLEKCCGIIVFAFSHLIVNDGLIHKDNSNEVVAVSDTSFPSPWMQIESAFALSNNLPCLIITQKGVTCNGLFDNMLVQNDDRMYMVEYDETLNNLDTSIVDAWERDVRKHMGQSN